MMDLRCDEVRGSSAAAVGGDIRWRAMVYKVSGTGPIGLFKSYLIEA